MKRRRFPVHPTVTGQLRRMLRDSRGATAIEYGLIVSLIVISMIAAFTQVASVTTGMWNNVSDKVQNSH